MRRIIALCVASLIWLTAAFAGDYEAGMAAHERKQYALAIEKFKASALAGNADAQFQLGNMYYEGFDDSKMKYVNWRDYERAVQYYTMAAKQGRADAQAVLGYIYTWTQLRDYAQAMNWFKMASAQQHSGAQFHIGSLYHYGKGVTKSAVEAAKWYKLSASNGDVVGQKSIGYLYELGEGVLQDYKRAYMWTSIAASNDYADAVEDRDRIAKRLTVQQVLDAQEMARKCQMNKFKNCD